VKHLRLWILGAALGSFVAGMNVGFAIPRVLAAGDSGAALPDQARDDIDYVQRIAATYGLSSAQVRSLRLVMQSAREDELRAFLAAEPSQLPPALQTKLLAARSKAEQRLRALLTEPQRARYDIDSRPQQNR